MSIGSASQPTEFALDVLGRYVCNSFDEALASSDPAYRANARDVNGNPLSPRGVELDTLPDAPPVEILDAPPPLADLVKLLGIALPDPLPTAPADLKKLPLPWRQERLRGQPRAVPDDRLAQPDAHRDRAGAASR
jgi:hypothetical protein